jgi:hypothetical protein
MNMAIPEAGCNRASRTIQKLRRRRNIDLSLNSYGGDLPVSDQDNAIRYGLL